MKEFDSYKMKKIYTKDWTKDEKMIGVIAEVFTVISVDIICLGIDIVFASLVF